MPTPSFPCLRMLTQPLFQPIPLETIPPASRWNIHPFLDDTPSPALRQSFEELGILHPPIVQLSTKSGHHLICGRKRVYALRHFLGQTTACCLVLPASLPSKTLLSCILTDQQLHAPLSPMESAFFIQHCLDALPEKEVVTVFLPRLGYRPQADLLDQLLALTSLDITIQRQVHQGLILEKTALELLNLSSDDRSTLSTLFQSCQMGPGKQKRLLTLAQDLANRTQQSISTLFLGQEFRAIIEHDEMNPPQKIHVLLESLQRKVSSRRDGAEQLFQKRIKGLDLPDNMTITHSLNFEKNEVFLTERFPDLESCEQAWRRRMNA